MTCQVCHRGRLVWLEEDNVYECIVCRETTEHDFKHMLDEIWGD